MLLTILLSSQIFLPVNSGNILDVSKETGPERIINNNLDISISAESALVVDVKSGRILYQKNSDIQRPIASITKLMTALIFLETQMDFEKIIKYRNSDSAGGETLGLKDGEEVKIKDLFYASLIASTNNTIRTLVRSTGMGEKKFVDLMNKKTQELNLKQTNFKDTTGLSKFNVSTATDVANILKAISLNNEITNILNKQEYVFETNLNKYKVENTNLLLNNKYFNIQFGKTGYIEEASWCFISFGKVKNNNIITVILGADSKDSRFQDTKALYWWVRENFKW